MAKRPVVNEDLCIGCSHCQEVCPKVFQLEDEKSQVIGARTSAAPATAI
jgi:ferredoxin